MLKAILGLVAVACISTNVFAQTPQAQTDAAAGPRILVDAPLRLIATADGSPFVLEGDAVEGPLGEAKKDDAGRGVRLLSGAKRDGGAEGSISFMVGGLKPEKGRWYRLRVRALVQDDFHVEKDDLYLRVDFFSDGGKNPLDYVKKSIYVQVDRERVDLADKRTNKGLGLATWRNYVLEFHTPFAEIDTLRLTAGFTHGDAKGPRGELWLSEVAFGGIPAPDNYVAPKAASTAAPPALSTLVKLGGRWYYDPRGESKTSPKQFDYTNAARLYYLSDRLEQPFADNMSAWRRKGYLEPGSTKDNPKLVQEDSFVPDNVVVTFTDKYLVMKSHNLPNHPTASFPDRWRLLDGNPNYIQEQDFTFYIPLDPEQDARHVAMDEMNNNHALPGGPIGVMANGIIFHNPFDERVYEDALWRLDRCCGHPSPRQRYHYHKYPVCTNTRWDDQGDVHSPLLGFAFDGFPVYGPYEGKGELARDSKTNPLNEFNVHFDPSRGWHYHVTPGKFPYLIGGFWGKPEAKNRLGGGTGLPGRR